jgi:hypothetical protein
MDSSSASSPSSQKKCFNQRQLWCSQRNHAAQTIIFNKSSCKAALEQKTSCALLVCIIGMVDAIARSGCNAHLTSTSNFFVPGKAA